MVSSPAYLDDKCNEIFESLTADTFSNVVLVVGGHGSGKTRLLTQVAAIENYRLLNIGKIMSEELHNYPEKDRHMVVESVLMELLKLGTVVIIDNTEILFQPELKLNVIRFLENLGRKRESKILVSIAGTIKGTNLIFSESPFYDNRKYDIHEFKTVYIGE